MRRMDEGEKEAVDGNEAEACYVVSIRILWACSKRFNLMCLNARTTRELITIVPFLPISHLLQP